MLGPPADVLTITSAIAALTGRRPACTGRHDGGDTHRSKDRRDFA